MYHIRTVLMVICILVVSASPAYAAFSDSTQVISPEYYCEVVKAEYAKYGIGCEIDTSNLQRDLTMADLEEAIERANDVGKNLEVTCEIEESSVELIRPDPARPEYIQANFKYVFNWMTGTYAPYVAQYRTIIEGRVDVQGSNIMGFDRYEHLFIGGVCYVSTDFRTNTVKDLGNANVSWSVSGYILFSWTEPKTGLSVQNNVPFSRGTTFSALNYTV